MSTNENNLNTEQSNNTPPKSNFKMLGVIALILVIGAVGFFILNGNGKKGIEAHDAVFKANKSLSKAKTLDISGKISSDLKFENLSEKDIAEINEARAILDDASLNYALKMDKDNKKYFFNFGITKKDVNVDFNIYTDSECIQIYIPQLSSKTLYFKWDDYAKLSKQYQLPQLHIKDYAKLFNLENSSSFAKIEKTYSDFYKNEFKNNIKITNKNHIVNFDSKKYDTVEYTLTTNARKDEGYNEKLMNKLKNDPDVKEFIISKGEEFLEIARANGDDKILEIPADYKFDTNETRTEIDEFFDELINPSDNTKLGMNQKMDLVTNYRIDSDNKFRQILIKSHVNHIFPESGGTADMTFTNIFNVFALDEKITIESPNPNNKLDLANATINDFIMLQEEIQNNVIKLSTLIPQ
ncbi:hypothetical protein WG909_06695 [Peptostreptococcaceae bacterium AGR-M142]